MNKLLVFMSFFLFVFAEVSAGKVEKVKLDDDHTKRLVSYDYCNISISKIESDDDGNSKISVEIENPDEKRVVVLFGYAQTEKALRRLPVSIKLDKYIPGTKGYRLIETSKDVPGMLTIGPNEKRKLLTFEVRNGMKRSCRLPFYIGKYRNSRRTKILLMGMDVLELEIDVEVKPDPDFIRLESECDSLIEDISKQFFCTHPKHIPSLESQEAPYKTRIVNIQTEIGNIIERHKWYQSDMGYKRYQTLLQKLDEIDFTAYERDCGKHHKRVYRHSCKYCNYSLQQIYHKLDDYYKKIYNSNSNNRKKTKESVMPDVNILYKCCTDGTCAKHASSWNRSEYKSKITDRYNRIINL